MDLPALAPPLELELAVPFWEAFERDEIVLPRCSSCHRFEWYPDQTGPNCEGATYEWVAVATTGTVHSITRVHRPFLSCDAQAVPFAVGFVELDGVDGARLVSNFDESSGLVSIGDRVQATFVDHAGRRRPVFHRLEL